MDCGAGWDRVAGVCSQRSMHSLPVPVSLLSVAPVRLLFLLQELHRQGTTVVIATHNHALIEKFRHPVLHLEDGILRRLDQDPVYDG